MHAGLSSARGAAFQRLENPGVPELFGRCLRLYFVRR